MKLRKKIYQGIKTRVLNSMYDWEGIKPTFVTSTGRTGTMFFSNFFSENFKDTVALHEPWPDLHDIGVNHHNKKFARTKTVDIIERERCEICKSLKVKGITHYLESNYNLSYILPFLEEVFGAFKLVHVIREPKSYLQSIFSVEEAQRHIYAEFDNRPRITAEDFDDDPYRDKWSGWTRFEKLCWHYYKVNTLIGDHIDANKNGITVQFKDIFKKENNNQGLWDIVDFVGFPLKENITKSDLQNKLKTRANKTKKLGLMGYENWTDQQKAIFHELTDPITERFGLS